MDIIIGGVTFKNTQIISFDSKAPTKNQERAVSLNDEIEDVTISYTHKYTLKMVSLFREKYREFYKKLIELDTTANGRIDIEIKGEIRAGIVHLSEEDIPETLRFDFDMTTINPNPKVYYDVSLPLSIYVAV